MSRQPRKKIAIIGAGLAGSACANVFARQGYAVEVCEQGAAPAAGASGVPVALFAPSVSADDAPHSRLLRQGVHLLLAELERLSQQGLLIRDQDWAMTGVLERCLRGEKRLPSTWLEPLDPLGLQSRMAAKPYEIWHGAAGWVNPKRLIAAWLSHPLIKFRGQSTVSDLAALDADATVVACGYQSIDLLPALKATLQPIRGQVEWGSQPDFDKLSPNGTTYPVNGMGHFIQTPYVWLAGATFQRDELDLAPRSKDVELNFGKLQKLRPELGKPYLARLKAESQSWVGVRTSQKNRAPFVQKSESNLHPNVWVCTGLGSRGLSLAALCASRLLLSVESGLAVC